MQRNFLKLVLVALTIAIFGGLFGGRHAALLADNANTGADFWIAFPGNSGGADRLRLNIVGTGQATVTVTYDPAGCALPGFPFTSTVTFTAAEAGVRKTVFLPVAASTNAVCSADVQTPGTERKGVHVTVNPGGSPVTVYGFSSTATSADGFLALPVNALGSQYYTVSHPGSDASSASQFVVVATDTGTTVSITPKADLADGHAAGTLFSVNLEKGETYLGRTGVGAGLDLTGTLITSNIPVAVFSGDRCSTIPTVKTTCDTTLEQLPPVSAWGRTFVTAPHLAPQGVSSPYTPFTTPGDLIRIVAAAPSTQVTVVTETGTASAVLLNAGDTVDLAGVIHFQTIKADKPILVAQFEQSRDNVVPGFNDPSMMVVTPYEQWLTDYAVATPLSSNPTFNVHFINLVAPATAVSSITLDGTYPLPATWVDIRDINDVPTGFMATRFQLGQGSHRLAGLQPFGVSIYGTGTEVSYSYPGGMSVAPVATVQSIELEVGAGSKYVGDEMQVRARALAGASGVAGVRVDFSASANTYVSGIANSLTTGSDGWTPFFSYVGTALVDSETVTASVGAAPNALSASTSVQWIYAIAQPDTFSNLVAGTPVTLDLLANDFNSDPGSPTDLRITSIFNQYPLANDSGTVEITPGNKTITYTPKPGFTGTVSFAYAMSHLLKNDYTQASVLVGVGGAPIATGGNPPTVRDDSFNVFERTPANPSATKSGDVGADNGAGIDFDPEGSALTFALEGAGPQNGVLVGGLKTNGSFEYKPNLNFHGIDSFQYKASDGFSSSTAATVTLTITDNQAPTATPNDYFMQPGESLKGNVILDDTGDGKDSDPEGDLLHVVTPFGPLPAGLTLQPNGRFDFQSTDPGTFTFTYKVTDAPTAAPTDLECDPGGNGCILNDSARNQLKDWIGTGPLQFQLLFSKRGGDTQTAADYHAAVDNVPRTLTIIRAKDDCGAVDSHTETRPDPADSTKTVTVTVSNCVNPTGPLQVFGGYNPGIFDGGTDSTVPPGGVTMPNAERKAFLFNLSRLTDPEPNIAANSLLRQRLSTNPCIFTGGEINDCGNIQVVNITPLTGPAWGDAWDLGIGCLLDGTCDLSKLEIGSTAASSYGSLGTGAFWSGANDRMAVFVSPLATGRPEWGCNNTDVCGQFNMAAPDTGFEVYTVRPLFTGAAKESAPATVTIHVVGGAMSLTGGAYSYDGQAHPAVCTMTASDGAILMVDVTYAPGGINEPKTVGTYDATCTFAGDTAGHPPVTKTLLGAVTITKAPVTLTMTLPGHGTFFSGFPTDEVEFTYDGQSHTIQCTGSSLDGPIPQDLLSVGSTPGNPLGPGVYQTTCSYGGDANHETQAHTVQITIKAPPKAVTVQVSGGPFVYDGNPHLATCVVTADGVAVTTGTTQIAYETYAEATPVAAPLAADTYRATCDYSGDADHQPGSGAGTITIEKRPLTITPTSGQTKVYGSADPVLAYQLTGTLISPDTLSGALTYGGSGNVGSYGIQLGTLTAGSNYVLTVVPTTFAITPARVTWNITGDGHHDYTGLDQHVTCAATGVNNEPLETSRGYSPHTPHEAGVYTATCEYRADQFGNYLPESKTVTLEIDRLGLVITPHAKSKVYRAAAGDPVLTFDYTGTKLPTDSFSGALGRAAGENVGAYAINLGTLTVNDNYVLTLAPAPVPVALTITPASLTVTANSLNKTFGTAVTLAGEFTTNGLLSGDSVTSVTLNSAGAAASAPVTALPYTITPSAAVGTGLSNYTISYATGTLTVAKGTANVAVAGTGSSFYNGGARLAQCLVTGADGSNLSGTSPSYTPGPNAPITVGEYTATCAFAGDSNHNAAAPTSEKITINPAPLTIKANNRTKIVGTTLALGTTAFTTNPSPLFGSDAVTSVTLTSAGAGAGAGIADYPIVPSAAVGMGLTNYTIIYANGTLSVLTANHAPVANPDTASTFESKAVTINVLANDTDVDGDVLTVSTVSTPAHGTATIGAGGVITYTPAFDFFGTETFTYTVVDGKGGSAVGTVTVSVSRLGRFVVLSRDVTWLKSNAVVLTGDVGANERRVRSSNGHGSEFDDGDQDDVTVRIGENVKVQEVGSRVVGDTVILRNKATIYDLVDNFTIDPGTPATILGTVTHPMTIPYVTMPAFPSFTAGTSNVEVAKKTTMTLAAGAYGTVRVRSGATLILTGGLYRMLSLDVDQSATVIFRAATEVRIKNELDTDNKSKMILDPAVSGLKASQVVFYVEGANDNCSHNGKDVEDGDNGGKASVHIGENNVIQANIYAPNGTIWIKSKTTATGAFIGQAVRVGQKTTLTLDSAFKF